MRDMEIIHLRDVIRGSRDRWLRQYKKVGDDNKIGWGSITYGEVRRRLAALDMGICSSADVDAAMGYEHPKSGSWATLKCDICDEPVESLMRMGGYPDYDARWVDACRKCLGKAHRRLVT